MAFPIRPIRNSSYLSDRVLEVRWIETADVRALTAIEEAVYPFPWTEGIFHDCLVAGCQGRVALQTGVIIGYVLWDSAAGEAHLLNLCIDAPYWGLGHGRALLSCFLDAISQQDVWRVYLEVRASNFPAIELYRSVGFKQIGTRKAYYPSMAARREDAVVFALDVNRSNEKINEF